MFKPTIKVSIETEPFEFRTVCKELSEGLIYDTFRPLDLPSRSADGLDRIFCTDTVTIERTIRKRRDIAKAISAAVTEALLDLMGLQDTEMGYTRAEKIRWRKS